MSTPSGKIEIYTTLFCPFCNRAKQLLDAKGVMYYETDVTTRLSLREGMTERAGGRTSVPQIFIDGQHIGGCNDLLALERSGQLDRLLQVAS
jgi:glutaredoxin 3